MLSDEWFSEPLALSGSAFSLRLGKRLARVESSFQCIEVFETLKWGRLMVIDGCTMVSDRDEFLYHEMMVHPALFSHPNPRRVAIIGGGDCGCLQQVLRHHSVESVVQVDIDEQVTRLSEQFFPRLCADNGDSRASILFEDGLAWMAAQPAGSLDVVIVDSTDPVGPATGLFGEGFFAACQAALAQDGLVVQQSESPLIHADLMAQMRAAMVAGGLTQPWSWLFPLPIYPSGWWSATAASVSARRSTPRWDAMDGLPGGCRYFSEAVFRGALALPPFLQQRLDEVA